MHRLPKQVELASGKTFMLLMEAEVGRIFRFDYTVSAHQLGMHDCDAKWWAKVMCWAWGELQTKIFYNLSIREGQIVTPVEVPFK